MKKSYIYAIIALAVVGGVVCVAMKNTREKPYDPVLSVSDFVPTINNKYLSLTPGTKFNYEGTTDDGTERIEVVVTKDKKIIQGVSTIVVRDSVRLNGVLTEDTLDYYAQDKAGNVWYFGEAVDNYENGKIVDHEGSWEAGVDGAKPGIAMLAQPKVGDSYRQEYYLGIAEDMGEVVALEKTITTPYGSLNGCLETKDTSRVDKTVVEYKYYCPGVAFLALETEGDDRIELTRVSRQ